MDFYCSIRVSVSISHPRSDGKLIYILTCPRSSCSDLLSEEVGYDFSLCHKYVINVHTTIISLYKSVYSVWEAVGTSGLCKTRIQCNKRERMTISHLLVRQ